jgi:hypothetical protein
VIQETIQQLRNEKRPFALLQFQVFELGIQVVKLFDGEIHDDKAEVVHILVYAIQNIHAMGC